MARETWKFCGALEEFLVARDCLQLRSIISTRRSLHSEFFEFFAYRFEKDEAKSGREGESGREERWGGRMSIVAE